MPSAPFQLYEAIVTNGAPDPTLPGHIEVMVPELFGDDPIVVAPMFAGWTAGGWQSTPGDVNPDDPTGVVQVIVAKLAENTYRWMGSSQAWSLVAGTPGSCGARSGDGRHAVRMSNDEGAVIESIAGNSVVVGADGTTTVLGVSKTTIGGALIWLGDGSSPPTERFILPSTFFVDLGLAMAELATTAITAGVPGGAPVATLMASNLPASLIAGTPYLSNRIFGS